MNFYNAVKNLAQGNFATTCLSTTDGGTIGANLIEAARRGISYLTNSLNKSNSFVSIFSSADWFITDSSIGGSSDRQDIYTDADTDLYEQVEAFIDDLDAWFNQFGVTQSVGPTPEEAIECKVAFMTLENGEVVKLGWGTERDQNDKLVVANLFTVANDMSDTPVTRSTAFHTYNLLTWVERSHCFISNTIHTVIDHSLNLWDVIKSAIDNNSVMEASLIVLQSVVQDSLLTVADLVSALAQFTISSVGAVRTFINDLLAAIRSGGVLSGLTFVLNIFKVQATCVYNEDGTMSFTDNSGLVPQAYTFGLFSTAGSLLSTAATIIAAAGHWIVSAIGFVLSVGFQLFGKIFDIDPSSTHGIIHHYGRNLMNLAPFAIGQRANATGEEKDAYLSLAQEESTYHEAMEVPGGKVFFGRNASGNMMCEFHPDLHDRRAYVTELFDAVIDQDSLRVAQLKGSMIQDPNLFMQVAGKYNDDNTVNNIQVDGNGHLTSASDSTIVKVLYYNMLLFSIYCSITRNNINSYNSRLWGLRFTFEQSYHAVSIKNGTASTAFVEPEIGFEQSSFDPDNATQARAAIMASGLFFAYESLGLVDGTPAGDYFLSDSYTQLMRYVIASQGAYYYPDTNGQRPGCTSMKMTKVASDLLFYDTIEELPSAVNYALELPQYDAASFWSSVIIGSIVTVAVAVVAVVTLFKVRKVIQRRRFRNLANIERTYNAAVKNPTNENIDAYRKASFRNNLFASVFGGTKYARDGMWNEGPSSGTIYSGVWNAAKTATAKTADVITLGMTSFGDNKATCEDILDEVRDVQDSIYG